MIEAVLWMLIAALPIAVPVLLVLLGGVPLARSNRGWIPAGQQGRPGSIRVFEAGLVVLAALPLLFLLLYERRTADFIPALLSEQVEPAVRSTMWLGFGVALVAIMVAAFVAWKLNTSLAAVALGTALAITALWVNIAVSDQHHEIREATIDPETPIPIRIELPQNLHGANIIVNGVNVGTSPVETTVQDLLKAVPVWSHRDADEFDDESFTEMEFTTGGFGGAVASRFGGLSLNVPHEIRDSFPETYVQVAADYKGMKGFTQLAQGRQTKSGVWVYTLETRFVEWEEDIEELFDRARIADYSPEPDWYEAFASYETWGWRQLQIKSTDEPELWNLVDGWANYAYDLENINSSADAWDVLMQICTEAVENRSYKSNSHRGRAVDLLVPRLDQEQLLHFAVNHLPDIRMPAAFSRMHSPGDRPWFATYNTENWSSVEILRWFPIAQAVWQLDRQLDALDADTDNIVETTITPAILQRVFREPSLLEYAEIIGGSAYDEFLLRQDWQTENVDDYEKVSLGDYENRVNKWYALLLNLNSAAGREFRRHQSGRLLQLAERGFDSHDRMTGSFPAELNFLFLDREWSQDRPSLAKQFWPVVDRVARSIPDHSQEARLRLRWDYLAKLWPESTVDDFVAAYLAQPPDHQYATLPPELDVADRFAILFAVQEALQNALEETPRTNRQGLDDPYTARTYQIQRISEQLRNLPYGPSAGLTLTWFAEGSRRKQLLDRMTHDRIHDDVVQQLAIHDESEWRLIALEAIFSHPTVRRIAIMNRLLNDPDDAVQKRAREVQEALNGLQTAPLPLRSE